MTIDQDALENCEGVTVFNPYGPISYGPDVFYMPVVYFAMPKEDYNALGTMDESEITEELIQSVWLSQTMLSQVLATNGSLEDVVALLAEGVDVEALGIEELGSADGFTFYYIPEDVENYREVIGDEWAESYLVAQGVVKEVLFNASLYAPVDTVGALVGTTASFETTDLDGNPVTSAELFAGNEITMINYWGTWCHNCVEEMEGLARIHTRLQEKGCGIIGILEDGDDPDKLVLAKEIMEENGTNYPNVLLSDSMEFLSEITSFPTSFFVDKNGTILSYPIAGQALDEYEAVIDQLLSNGTVSGITMPDAGVNNKNAYRVIVKDYKGDPIQGVAVQFCDDSTCNLAKTDAEGIATFDMPECTVYIVHILKVPEGYERDGSEYHTLDVYSDVVIVLGENG